jgi:Ca2+-transporting ATPase
VALQEFSTGIVIIARTVLKRDPRPEPGGQAAASVEALRKMLIVEASAAAGGWSRSRSRSSSRRHRRVRGRGQDLADRRLLTAASLEIEEAALTGESIPVAKSIEAIEGDQVALRDRIDLCLHETKLTLGCGEGVVTSTGTATEVGHISGILSSVGPEKTPLTRQLDQLTR